jgi:hypothetical protein
LARSTAHQRSEPKRHAPNINKCTPPSHTLSPGSAKLTRIDEPSPPLVAELDAAVASPPRTF